jgi:hypothetical protein
MAFSLRIPNTDKIGEGFMLGLGIFAAYILARGALKLADQYSGGVIPDEFIAAQGYVGDDGYITEY